MSSFRQRCRDDPASFCNKCGEYILKGHKKSITEFVRKVCHAYFQTKIGDRDSTCYRARMGKLRPAGRMRPERSFYTARRHLQKLQLLF